MWGVLHAFLVLLGTVVLHEVIVLLELFSQGDGEGGGREEVQGPVLGGRHEQVSAVMIFEAHHCRRNAVVVDGGTVSKPKDIAAILCAILSSDVTLRVFLVLGFRD